MNLLETISGGEILGFYPQMEASPAVGAWHTSSESFSIKRKQSHNAYERDRRKKINALYSSLRSLLPQSENNKKLSIPNTVARVLDYVPELQRQVERLERRKEEIAERMRRESDVGDRSGCSALVSVADLGGGEVAIQVCAVSRVGKRGLMSAVMEYLGSEGLVVMSATTLAVDASRTLISLHCQVRNGSVKVDAGRLRKNLPGMLR